ncbi:MAG: hypothetical protein GC186_17205 [Rhodobacteraceae bacterium]|nr:hypothetical protein [Paracoccaceae bacterium]
MPDLRVLALALALPAAVNAACHDTRFDGAPYTVCDTSFGQDDLRLWVTAPDGLPVGTFGRLADLLAAQGKHFGFAINAGMYAPDLRPLGLAIVDGQQIAPLVTGASKGNFGLLPNGVFCIGPDRYRIVETRHYAAAPPACRYATQSGPMLVIGGALHPRFLATSGSTYIRNGVGVSADGLHAAFAISGVPVTFDAFARFFRDGLKMPDALFLDGNTSRLAAPELNRADAGFPMGPILGTVVDGPAPAQ